MLLLYMLQSGILLIIGKGNTQNIGVFDDVVEQRAATQFNVIGVRAEEQDALTKKFHIVRYPTPRKLSREMFRML